MALLNPVPRCVATTMCDVASLWSTREGTILKSNHIRLAPTPIALIIKRLSHKTSRSSVSLSFTDDLLVGGYLRTITSLSWQLITVKFILFYDLILIDIIITAVTRPIEYYSWKRIFNTSEQRREKLTKNLHSKCRQRWLLEHNTFSPLPIKTQGFIRLSNLGHDIKFTPEVCNVMSPLRCDEYCEPTCSNNNSRPSEAVGTISLSASQISSTPLCKIPLKATSIRIK